MTRRFFTPHLGLRPGKGGTALLSASTLVPSGHFSALEGRTGAPEGIAVVPEVFPVTLPLAYTKTPATQALKVVHHGPLELTDLNESHQHVVAFTVLDGKILGRGSIGNPTHTLGAAFRSLGEEAKEKSAGALGVEAMTWAAWVDNMPMAPRSLHVVGRVLVPNPGIVARLQRAVPQGFNPAILLLELVQHQLPGIWPQVVVPREVDYVEEPYADQHQSVAIVSGSSQVASVEIEQVH